MLTWSNIDMLTWGNIDMLTWGNIDMLTWGKSRFRELHIINLFVYFPF